ncbi:MAG: hypothetical protein KatS3mg120_0024 [Erythrobacter sp.]|nr:MAG: hypothetical protein KatS3mg120_0024 [Erythrobacter sp.]
MRSGLHDLDRARRQLPFQRPQAGILLAARNRDSERIGNLFGLVQMIEGHGFFEEAVVMLLQQAAHRDRAVHPERAIGIGKEHHVGAEGLPHKRDQLAVARGAGFGLGHARAELELDRLRPASGDIALQPARQPTRRCGRGRHWRNRPRCCPAPDRRAGGSSAGPPACRADRAAPAPAAPCSSTAPDPATCNCCRGDRPRPEEPPDRARRGRERRARACGRSAGTLPGTARNW